MNLRELWRDDPEDIAIQHEYSTLVAKALALLNGDDVQLDDIDPVQARMNEIFPAVLSANRRVAAKVIGRKAIETVERYQALPNFASRFAIFTATLLEGLDECCLSTGATEDATDELQRSVDIAIFQFTK